MVVTLASSRLYDIYLQSSRVRYASPETKYRYLRVVSSFLRYTDEDLSQEKLVEFMHSLEKHSTSYQRWIYQILKGFYEEVEEKWPLHPRDLPPSVEPERPYLETDEAQLLMKLAKADPLDYAIFRLVLVTGIRKREVRELNIKDYDPPRVTIRTRKHGEVRVRTLDVETVEALDTYVNGRRKWWRGKYKGQDAPLFLSNNGKRLPDSTLAKKFSTYMRVIGKPKGCGLHSMRRTVVTWEAEGKMTDMEIQKLHGWKSPMMPAIYARLKPAKLEKESYGVNPLISKGDGGSHLEEK